MGHGEDKSVCKSVRLLISAGCGPKECAWLVAQLIPKMIEQARKAGLQSQVIDVRAYDKHLRNQALVAPDAYTSCVLALYGANAALFSRQWIGTIKWQGQSIYRPTHARQNWFVSVTAVAEIRSHSEMPEQFMRDVQIKCIRAKGPGGQHVNKTSSAVQLLHKPTGLTVKVEDTRSQHRNRELAIARLAALLQQAHEQTLARQRSDQRLQHFQLERGRPVKIFTGVPLREVNF